MSSDSSTVQLGFSEPIVDPSDICFVAHNSPKWIDWDGGKIGGKPSWLNPEEIPPNSPLRCIVCQRRNSESGRKDDEATALRFLVQIYSPADCETGNSDAFHRSLYVFCCPNPLCSSSEHVHESVVVLRCQLPKQNKYYPVVCGDDNLETFWKKHSSVEWGINLCIICGQRASGKCPVSNQWFCCKTHQRHYHKASKKAKHFNHELDLSSCIYQESELVVEEEPVEQSSGTESHVEVEEINKSSLFSDSTDETDELLEQSDLNEITGADANGTSDPYTLEFYTRIGRSNGSVKSQCVRYCRWPDEKINDDDNDDLENGPLWISSADKLAKDEDVPCCEYCGAKRKFEFQIMPQIVHFLSDGSGDNQTKEKANPTMSKDGKTALLAAADIVNKAKQEGTESALPEGFQERQEELVNKFKAAVLQDDKREEALDFGTILVYTCTKSCGGEPADRTYGSYRKEFAWRQKPLG